MSYVDTTGTIGMDLNNAPSSTFSVSNCTFTGTAGAGVNANAGTYTFSSCTFTGVEGTWYDEDLRLNTGAQIQCDSCTFTTAGMQATSGWLVSKTHGGTANATRIYGILSADSPAAAYQIADTDNVSVLNADAYSSSFNTALTINQNETCNTLATAVNTTVTVNATYTLTVSANSATISGRLTINGTMDASNKNIGSGSGIVGGTGTLKNGYWLVSSLGQNSALLLIDADLDYSSIEGGVGGAYEFPSHTIDASQHIGLNHFIGVPPLGRNQIL
jgi:hypothetical protein